ncbi:MAG: discoidin domain-containing protein [bacterium]
MKTHLLTLLSIVVAAIGYAAEPSVTEIRQADGNSVIQVKAADGKLLASYPIDLATHHYPATSPDDPVVKKIKAWKFGAFLCYNSNQYSGAEYCTSKDPALAPPMPITYGGRASASGIWNPEYAADKAFDGSPATRWGGAENSKDGWLEIDLGKPKRFSKATINEGWGRTRKFELQIKVDGQWQTIHKGTAIGADYSATFKPVTAQYVRLMILEAIDVPTIWEFELVE